MNHFLNNVDLADDAVLYWNHPSKLSSLRWLEESSPADRSKLVLDLIPRWHLSLAKFMGVYQNDEWSEAKQKQLSAEGGLLKRMGQVFHAFMELQPVLDESTLNALIGCVVNEFNSFHLFPFRELCDAILRFGKDHELSAETRVLVQPLALGPMLYGNESNRKMIIRLRELLGQTLETIVAEGEAWSDAALARLRGLNDAASLAWRNLLAHCQMATSAKPSDKWLRTAGKLLESIDAHSFRAALVEWFPLVDKPRTQPAEHEYFNLILIPHHADLLKGLVWCCPMCEDRALTRALGALAASSFRKIPGKGPRQVALGNACIYALGAIPTEVALSELALLKVKLKSGSAQIALDKALMATAQRLGVAREEIEEMSVPAYGMSEVGVRRETLGDYRAEIHIVDTATTELLWLTPQGKPQKSIPSVVQKEFADDLKELRAAVKDIQRMLPAQRERLDNLYLQQKRWPLQVWRQRYFDHPLVGVLTRRLIWRFHSATGEHRDGIELDGQLVDVADQPIDLTADGIEVELWHPISEPVERIVAWREWLERHQRRQPFKQAHREVYLLTDAELNTRLYSNRFAAHVLRQHQFNALCSIRGWKNQLRLMVDSNYHPPTRFLPQWNLRAEFWVEGAGDQYGQDTNETGTYLYLTTDQVRFYPVTANQRSAHAGGGGYTRYDDQIDETLPLENVPPLVLSEIMRDVDMFVGVSSIGNDPNWLDTGADGRVIHRTYWQSYAFGELSEAAKTRRELLERLVPRLKIAPRCTMDDKFLIVRGELRTYKIHLGSGNILMTPNDQYLCIVPKQGGKPASNVFLPFDGDSLLSIILSKAMLLADDKKITDPTIMRQIIRE